MLLRQVPATKPDPPLAASARRWPHRALHGTSKAPQRLPPCSSSSSGSGAGAGGGRQQQGEPAPQLHELQLQMWSAKQRMERCAQAGEYAEAAAARDKLRALELRLRQRELEALARARSTVLHSIGQVISHRRFGYRGVIVGYDPTCEASEDWIQVRHCRRPCVRLRAACCTSKGAPPSSRLEAAVPLPPRWPAGDARGPAAAGPCAALLPCAGGRAGPAGRPDHLRGAGTRRGGCCSSTCMLWCST